MLKWISVNDVFKPQYVVHWMHLTMMWRDDRYSDSEREETTSAEHHFSQFGMHNTEDSTRPNDYSHRNGERTYEARWGRQPPHLLPAHKFRKVFACDVNIFNYIRNKWDQMQTLNFSWCIRQCSASENWMAPNRLGHAMHLCISSALPPSPPAIRSTKYSIWRVFVLQLMKFMYRRIYRMRRSNERDRK